MDQPAVYVIRIKGSLEPNWSDWFDGLSVTPEIDDNTSIIGLVQDQAALFSLLLKVHDLNLELISVVRRENEA